MFNIRKYALAAALVIPSALIIGANESEAAKLTIDKKLASGVNVRSEAQMGDNIVGLISDSEKQYEIKGEEGEWLKIDFDGKEAFVAGRFFHILDEDEIISDANLRKGPTLDDEVIKVLSEGTKVEVLEVSENGYVKVAFGEGENKEEGYVYNNLLKSFREANEQKAAAYANQQAQAQAPAKSNEQPVASQAAPQQVAQQPVQQQQVVQETYQGSSNWAKEWIAQRESNGSYTAYNPNGGYYGRYQLNPSLIHYGASPAEQEAAADAYVAQRYGSWEAAQSFWAANGWY